MTTNQILIGVGLILVLAVGAQVLASRLRIPAIIVLLPAGFIAGALTSDVNPERLLGPAFEPLVSLSGAAPHLHPGDRDPAVAAPPGPAHARPDRRAGLRGPPLAAFASTLRTDLGTGERAFIGWMAPRGIVARPRTVGETMTFHVRLVSTPGRTARASLPGWLPHPRRVRQSPRWPGMVGCGGGVDEESRARWYLTCSSSAWA